MSDLFENHIVGFPIRRLKSNCLKFLSNVILTSADGSLVWHIHVFTL